MKNINQRVFTTGEFAKMHHINSRTLHYYDNIGLFSPAFKGCNGYRYYTLSQSPNLEMVLAMRELGMSIEEITSYLTNRSPDTFQYILQTKSAEIDDKIQNLIKLKQLLNKKKNQIVFSEHVKLDQIELITMPQEHILLSSKVKNAYDDVDLDVLTEHMRSIKEARLFNHIYGAMISVEKILKRNLEIYDYYYSIVDYKKDNRSIFVKPAGTYIRYFSKGNWDQLPSVYESILSFTDEKGLKLTGYAYEEGINEMTISNQKEYITKISIRCEEASCCKG